jgi:hypothetical protein
LEEVEERGGCAFAAFFSEAEEGGGEYAGVAVDYAVDELGLTRWRLFLGFTAERERERGRTLSDGEPSMLLCVIMSEFEGVTPPLLLSAAA